MATDARFDTICAGPRTGARIFTFQSTLAAALAEVFQRRRTINTRRMIPWLVGLETAED